MAKLSAHGTELLRVDNPGSCHAYFSDGHILRNCGDGWKRYKRFKPGVNVPDAVNRKRVMVASRPTRVPALHEYLCALKDEFPALENRARAHTYVSLLHDDVDGLWSELNDTHGQSVDLETCQRLARAYKAMCEESRRLAERQRLEAGTLSAHPLPAGGTDTDL